jgi:ribosome assembly protein RRB1
LIIGRTVPHLLASGADDGSFSVWDLRYFNGYVDDTEELNFMVLRRSEKPAPAASFQWHKEQITSIEWHPHEESVLAVSGADDQLTIWDFSVEQDEEEMVIDSDMKDIPPQLLFIHQVSWLIFY